MALNIYLKRGWETTIDTLPVSFMIDSVTGRGFNREALISMSHKVGDSTQAYWIICRRDTTPRVYDSTIVNPYVPQPIYDTVAYLRTHRRLGHWYRQQWADSGASYHTWTMPVTPPSNRFEYYEVRLWKIVGDATRNYGRDQMCLIRIRRQIKLHATFLDSLINVYKDIYIR